MASNYTIKSGDNLWNICKRQFKLSNNAEIAKKVSEVAKNNGISNPNLIFAGKTLELGSAMDTIEKTPENNETQAPKQSAAPQTNDIGKKYNDWASSKENYDKMWDYIQHDSKGKSPVEDFDFLGVDMTKVPVEKKAETYKNGLLNFSQSVIASVDTDGDEKTQTFDEFFKVQKQMAETLDVEIEEKDVEKEFQGMDINGDGKLDDKEIAATFAYKDMDDKNEGKLDGKFTHVSESITNFGNEQIKIKLKEIYSFLFGKND